MVRTAAALCASLAALLLPAASSAGTLYMGGYPNVLLLFDEATGQVTRRIPLATG
ncbi:hypothetical protein LTR94_028971, partial [Friedmanniomyces endolithicus]